MNTIKYLVQRVLAWKAKRIIKRHNPTVVAVTGSVGKTSTRNAIATVLEKTYHVRTNRKNYNNEFGVPFTIIGVESPGRSVWGWIKLFFIADKQILFGARDYPNMLVLEFGVDRPGDMDTLCDIAEPDVGVLTAISPVHVENFGTLKALIVEKTRLLKRTKENGIVVINADDPNVYPARHQTMAHAVTYGTSGQADVRAEHIDVETRNDFSFDPGELFAEIHFDVRMNGETYPALLRDLLGRGQVMAALAAVAVGDYFDIEEKDMLEQLSLIEPQAGRMRPLAGIKGALILDDSYNAAPASTTAALDTLRLFEPVEGARHIAALGTMAELGIYSEPEHKKIGAYAVETGVDVLVAVGEPARDILRGAEEAGMDTSKGRYFDNSHDAGRWLDKEVRKGDVVLVKGSQSVRMEKVVKDLMAEPLRAEELLVRQYGKWLEEGNA